MCPMKDNELWDDPMARKPGRFESFDGVYEGELIAGVMPDGQGKMTYPDGRVYEGGWLGGKRHGRGKVSFSSGAIIEGEWENGKGNGHFKYFDGEGDIFDEVDYINGVDQNGMKDETIEESIPDVMELFRQLDG